MTKLYASALHLDRKAQKALAITDAYSVHRVVYSLFDDVRNDEEKKSHIPSGIVYADCGGDFQARKILIVSDRQPAARVDGQYGQVESKIISPEFLQHRHYRFKVQVNPIRKDSLSGQRIAIKGRQDIALWFMERANSSWGFTVDPQHLQIDRIEVLQFHAKEKNPVTIAKAHIQGQLTVSDQQHFQQSFKLGIGKARAFGCGLLQVVPIIDSPFA